MAKVGIGAVMGLQVLGAVTQATAGAIAGKARIPDGSPIGAGVMSRIMGHGITFGSAVEHSQAQRSPA